MLSIVNEQYASAMYKLHPCHRLDRDTSGVIIFAKGKKAQQDMMALFEARKIKKIYRAFVYGKLDKMSGEICKAVLDQEERHFRKNSVPKSAITRYKVLGQYEGFADLEVELLTGRTNQIRIHFSEAGHPLVGERKYAFGRDHDIKFRRVALHAASVSWTDPVSGRKICVESLLPKDLRSFQEKYQ